MALSAGAQKMQLGYYNYNIYNGMPSNHVYQVIVDTYGYAWIATTKGVLKYNGYTFRKFGLDEGLAKEDVWYLMEDNANKIWLGSITNNFGYIQNNRFKTVISNSFTQVYPHGLQKIDNGIAFFPDSIAKRLNERVDIGCRIRNGIVERFIINSGDAPRRNLMFTANGEIYELRNSNVIYKVSADGKYINRPLYKTSIPTSFIDTMQRFLFNSDKHFIVYSAVRNTIYFIDVKNGAVTTYYDKLGQFEYWLVVHRGKEYYYLVSSKKIVVLDYKLRYIRTNYLKDMLPEDDTTETSFVWYMKDRFWNGFSTTANKGMYQHFAKNAIRKLPVENVSNAEYVGKPLGASTSYWWNNNTHELISVKETGELKRRNYGILHEVREVVGFPNLGSFLYAKYQLYDFNPKTGEIRSFIDRFKWYYHPEYGNKVMPINDKYRYLTSFNIMDLYMYKDSLYIGAGQAMYKNYFEKDTLKAMEGQKIISKIHTIDTISKNLYAFLRNWLIADHLFTNKRDSISVSALKQLGIDEVNALKFDTKNAGLYMLSKSGLFVFNIRKRILQKLPMHFVPTACNMQIDGNNLILNSPYGLVFYKLHNDGSVSNPYYVINYKYRFYKFLKGDRFFVGDSTVVFNTDNGLMSVPIPNDSLYINNNTSPAFKLTVTYKDKLGPLMKGDTLKMDQRNPVFLFDVINPYGVGTPRFYYYVPGTTESWQQLNGTEWFVTNLRVGVYNKVYLKVTDEGWNSPAIMVWVYIKPYWWQTTIGKSAIATMLLLLLGGAVFLAIQITRRQVNKVNARRNLEAELKSLRTSMELKSIHAQINPHFIFNTLSTGLYFIKKNKMEDAYDHITAFSELLRNYIKSSREKYITLQEEIDNLKRYVTLQQSRFENLHEFDVEIGEGVNVSLEKIPALLLQPIVENAINHGLFHKSKPGRLLLRFEKNNNELTCIIDDDGVGRERAKEINAETKHKTQSYGTDLVRELIEAFNKYEPVHITIEYIDKLAPESGTTVILTIKELKDDK